MNKSNDKLSGIIFDYDSGMLPPPYSNVFHLELNWKDDKLVAKLDLHYTNREDISEAEIFEEGFTHEDDYSFEGELNSIWMKVARKQFQSAKWSGKQLTDAGIIITAVEDGKTKGSKVPMDQEAWQLLAQDIIQAIYETNKKEAPLRIQYRSISNEATIDCAITMNFSSREAIVTQNGNTKIINWEYAVELMKLIFSPDYNYEFAKEALPTKRGLYIECGDGFWHDLNKGVSNIDESFDAVGMMKVKFEDIIR